MFPISHVYMLNRLVNKKFGRNLDSRDAKQIMGSWLLDAIVNKEMRGDKNFKAQAYFHNLEMYSPSDKLQAGVLIHVMSDNLANYNTLRYDKQQPNAGFISRRESLLYVPDEELADKKDDLRRRILQCALDMHIVRAAKEEIKEYFSYATSLFKGEEMCKEIYDVIVTAIKLRRNNKPEEKGPSDAFIDTVLKNVCFAYLKQSIERYGPGFEYTACDWRRASAARDAAGDAYCKAVSMVDLIQSNFSVLDGWEQDIDTAAGVIIQKKPEIFQSFS